MRRPRCLARLLLQGVFVACVVGLMGHALTGHAHADLLAAAPAHEHVPGDDHHDAAGGSCEALRAPTPDGPPAVLVEDAIEPVWSIAASMAARTFVRPVLAQPPLFLLHASLLI